MRYCTRGFSAREHAKVFAHCTVGPVMPLIECPDCRRRISDQAVACIHCGCPLPKLRPTSEPSDSTTDESFYRSAVLVALAILVLVVVVALQIDSAPSRLRPPVIDRANRATVDDLPPYRIAKQEIIDRPTHGKAKLYVAVDASLTNAQLRQLLEGLRRQAMVRTWKCNCEPGVWIWAYADANAPQEATDQWIAMLADSPIGAPEITISDERTKPAVPAEARAGRVMIGRWKYVSAGIHWVTSIYTEGGATKEEMSFSDGTRLVRSVVKSQHPEGTKYMEPGDRHGEYVVAHENGELGLYSPDGKWGTAKPLDP